MTRIPGALPSPAVVTASAAATALLTNLPDTVRHLAVGALLSGTVLTRDSSGLTMLQTGAGVFGVKTTVPLPAGSAVTLQVQSAGAQLQAIVLSVTPQPGRGAPPAPPAAAPHAPSPPTAPSGPPPLDGPAGPSSTIAATVIGPPGGQAARAVPTGTLPAGAAPVPAGSPVAQANTGEAASPATAASRPAPAGASGLAPPAAAATAPPLAPSTPPQAPQLQATQPQPASGGNAATTEPIVAARSTPPGATPPAPASGERPGAPETALAPLPTGSKVQVRLASAPLPAAGAAPPDAPTPALTPGAILRGLVGSAGGAAPSASTPAVAPSSAPPGVTVAATLVARTPSGQTIVDTPAGRLIVALPAAMDAAPPGTRFALEMMLPGRVAGAPLPAAPGSPGALARDWPALRDVVRMLLDSPDDAARNAVDRAMPRPGPRFGQQILSFIESAGAGGVRDWLGDAARQMLERLAGPTLLVRLDDDLREMLARRAGEGQWHMTVVPFLDGQDLRQVRFFERHKKKDERDKNQDTARFVVECEHGEFGALQLDGLMHDRRLDLILRSHDRLPLDVENDILALFNLACAGLALAGHLTFQVAATFPVNPLDEFATGGVRVSV